MIPVMKMILCLVEGASCQSMVVDKRAGDVDVVEEGLDVVVEAEVEVEVEVEGVEVASVEQEDVVVGDTLTDLVVYLQMLHPSTSLIPGTRAQVLFVLYVKVGHMFQLGAGVHLTSLNFFLH